MEIKIQKTPRSIDIKLDTKSLKLKGFRDWFWYLYNTDIFINNVPVIKCLVLSNIIIWIILYFN